MGGDALQTEMLTLRDRWRMERKTVNNGHYLRVPLEQRKGQDAGTLKKEI